MIFSQDNRRFSPIVEDIHGCAFELLAKEETIRKLSKYSHLLVGQKVCQNGDNCTCPAQFEKALEAAVSCKAMPVRCHHLLYEAAVEIVHYRDAVIAGRSCA